MLTTVMGTILLAGASLGGPDLPDRPASFLFKMKVEPDKTVRFAGVPYCPQEGDILLFDDHNPWITKLYKLCGTGGPLHAGIVFTRPDGKPAILEAGPNFNLKVMVTEIGERLPEYKGMVLVRQLKTPLSAEQSKKLTEFCQAQEGKLYAVGRLVLQGTPLKARGKLTGLLGKTSLDRDRWICSELVVAAAAAAGVLDGKTFPANGIYPRDLAYDEHFNLSPVYDRPALWYPRGELEYVGGAIRVAPSK